MKKSLHRLTLTGNNIIISQFIKHFNPVNMFSRKKTQVALVVDDVGILLKCTRFQKYPLNIKLFFTDKMSVLLIVLTSHHHLIKVWVLCQELPPLPGVTDGTGETHNGASFHYRKYYVIDFIEFMLA